jgi:hypothetical protein
MCSERSPSWCCIWYIAVVRAENACAGDSGGCGCWEVDSEDGTMALVVDGADSAADIVADASTVVAGMAVVGATGAEEDMISPSGKYYF